MVPNVLNDSSVRSSTAIATKGRNRGKVTSQKSRHPSAPSTAAASRGSGGMPCSPAIRIRATNGVHCQTSRLMTVNHDVWDCSTRRSARA